MKVYTCQHCPNLSGFVPCMGAVMCIDCGCFDVTEQDLPGIEKQPEWDSMLIMHLNLIASAQVDALHSMHALVDGRQ
jgi:hypothetical protein